MSSFAPVYRPPIHRQSFLTREQKRERKRKRSTDIVHDDDGDDDFNADSDAAPGPKDEAEEFDTPRAWRPINKTDQFYVAGVARDAVLPGANFPHASPTRSKEKPVIEDELARLNPPLFVSRVAADAQDGSLKRRHLDNLTVILHKCMLNGDWDRASRVWGLILQTEVQGRGVDIRHNGRWMVGGEILMRRSQPLAEQPSYTNRETEQGHTKNTSVFSDEGFRLVREYYERMTLQYPHMPRQRQTTVDALAIYPALFNVWVFEVQDRAGRARQTLLDSPISVDRDTNSESGQSEKSAALERGAQGRHIIATELEEALGIARRMDDLMLNPPYDTSPELLHLRSMISLWLCDLHSKFTAIEFATADNENMSSEEEPYTSPNLHIPLNLVAKERDIAARTMQSMRSVGVEVPGQLSSFLEDVSERFPEEDG